MFHVFVVNDTTFKYHLEYLFAGTCALENPVFLEDKEYQNSKKKKDGLTARQELSICEMIADVSRIREGDKILFYLTQTSEHEGMFFGTFAVKDKAFFDSNTDNYLASYLEKNLNFRVQIIPDKVYAYGVSEREALDSLAGISHPSQMCWSLIYRKLKGKRGCTMITDYEARRLCNLIDAKNNRVSLDGSYFTYDAESNLIKSSSEENIYTGNKESIDIKDRMIVKEKRKKAYEAHLQAYILQHIDEEPLCSLLDLKNDEDLWIGNEVSCGVGMQSIDIMTQQSSNNTCLINIIELKCVEPYDSILSYQLPKYIDWVMDYIIPLQRDFRIKIQPIIIAKKFEKEEQLADYIQRCNSWQYKHLNSVTISKVKYIGYEINDDISFERLN